MVPTSNRTYSPRIPTGRSPDEIRVTGYGAGYGGWRTIVYTALFVVCLLAVSDFIPLWLMCVIVFVAFLLCDRRVFRNVDWGLPLTFCMFFIFIGNMKRVPEFYELAASLVGAHPLEVAVVSSQFISNVPTTLLLSGFCDQWRELIIGTNLGGLGTLIASMASLIGYKNVTRATRTKRPLSGRLHRGERAVRHRARRPELDYRVAFGRRPVSLTANLKVAGSHLLLGLHENPWNHWISRVYCYVG